MKPIDNKEYFDSHSKQENVQLGASSSPETPTQCTSAALPRTWSRNKMLRANVEPAITTNYTPSMPYLRRNNSFNDNTNPYIKTTSSCTLSYSFSDDDDVRPSTSAGSIRKQLSNLSLISANSSPTTTSSFASSPSSQFSTTTACHIDLIKCEDIKVWTDQTRELNDQQQSTPVVAATESYNIPQSRRHRKNSTSPLNSFLATLFHTPTRRSRCSSLQQLNASVDYPLNTQYVDVSRSSSVLNAFLPIDGKKLRSRQTEQNFFEDGDCMLDYTTSTIPSDCCPAIDASVAALQYIDQPKSKKNENLTVFLQRAHLSRNNTDLEKENAHFQVSEAIISVIEHIKWAKIEPDKRYNNCSSATIAVPNGTGCQRNQSGHIQSETETEPNLPVVYSYSRTNDESAPSAEDVGLSLIAKFKQQHLPQVSALKWLVAEKDTPQKLLPMPDDRQSTNSDDILLTRTRGTNNWAPPRPQIIFTDHAPLSRKQLLKKQNMRCAGCGMRVATPNSDSFRYCTYLGKYHCTGCHRNQIAATPAKILQMWNFKCYPVSVFAYRLLEQMYTFPLFYVPDLNPDLYGRSKALLEARNKRYQLKFVADFIKTCRYAEREQHFFDIVPKYLTNDPDMWSLADFHEVHSKNMQRFIDDLIAKCEDHIFECLLCSGRGFICTYCLEDQVIFPWESETSRCDSCGTCFHYKCWQSMLAICCRCQRIKRRQLNEAGVEEQVPEGGS